MDIAIIMITMMMRSSFEVQLLVTLLIAIGQHATHASKAERMPAYADRKDEGEEPTRHVNEFS